MTRLLFEARILFLGIRCLAWAPIEWALQRIEKVRR